MDDDIAAAVAAVKDDLGDPDIKPDNPAPDEPQDDQTPEPDDKTDATPSDDKSDDDTPDGDKKDDRPRDASGRFIKSDDKDDSDDSDDDDEPFELSAEILAKINESPELQAVYRSMQGGATKKFQAAAKIRKEAEQAISAMEFMRANPRQAAELIAKEHGLKIVEVDAKDDKVTKDTVTDVTDDIMARWEKKVGKDAAGVLGPLVRETAEAVAKSLVESQLKPVQDRIREQDEAAHESNTRAAINEFGAKVKSEGGRWDNKIVAAMNEQMAVLEPGENATREQYLEALYERAVYRLDRKSRLREEVKRLKRARQTEPDTTVRPSKGPESKIDGTTPDKDAFSMAVAAARAELSQ